MRADSPGPEPDEYTAAYAFIERRKCRQGWETASSRFSPGIIEADRSPAVEAPAQAFVASLSNSEPFCTEEGDYNAIAKELARDSFISSNRSASTEYCSIFIFRGLSSNSSIRLSTSTGQ